MKSILFLLTTIPSFLFSQFGTSTHEPISWYSNTSKLTFYQNTISADSTLRHQAEAEDINGSYYVGYGVDVSFGIEQFHLVQILPNGDKLFQLNLKIDQAIGVSIFFDTLEWYSGSQLWVFDKDKKDFKGMYSVEDARPDHQFSTSPIFGQEIVIEYKEPKEIQTSKIHISKLYNFFRGLQQKDDVSLDKVSGICQVNINCEEGLPYNKEKNSTCKILIYGNNFAGYCTGTLVNNTAQDQTPYILTANHCGQKSAHGDYPNWEFMFMYEYPSCTHSNTEPDGIYLKGCTYIASSGVEGGKTSSDFLLVKLVKPIKPEFNLYFSGWDRSDIIANQGACIHHPRGDKKKISFYNKPIVSSGYGQGMLNTHYRVNWAATANGYGTTEGGSSGSGLLNESKQLIGTLSGGTAHCSFLTGDDYYGKFSQHWDQFDSTKDHRLKDWLDPLNTNLQTLQPLMIENVVSSIKKTSDEFYIYSENEKVIISWQNKMFDIQIYDLMENLIYDKKGIINTITINDFDFDPSIYILKINSNDQEIVKKIRF